MATDRNQIFVLGASGFVGTATLKALSAAGATNIVAGVRNPDSDKAKPLAEIPNVTVVAASMGGDSAPLASAKTAFIVSPGAENRAELAIAGAKAAKEAGVENLVVVSVAAVGMEADVLFKRQFVEVEEEIKKLDADATFLRLPMFTDNNWGNAGSIKGEGKIYGPADPEKGFCSISVGDIGDASAAVLQNPGAHKGKTYVLAGAPYTHNELAAAFSSALGKDVSFVRVPYPAALEAFVGLGFAEWQAAGVLELYHQVDSGAMVFPTDDFEAIVGRKPQTIGEWVESVKGGFM